MPGCQEDRAPAIAGEQDRALLWQDPCAGRVHVGGRAPAPARHGDDQVTTRWHCDHRRRGGIGEGDCGPVRLCWARPPDREMRAV
jgi:hypothetical protein